MTTPKLERGDSFFDQRGVVSPVELPAPAWRFYISENKEPGIIRAWHGHPKEWRVIRTISGKAKVALLKMDDHSIVRKFDLYGNYLLTVPPGWATGWQSVDERTMVLFLSPSSYAHRDDVLLDSSIRAEIWTKPWDGEKYWPAAR